MKLRFDDPPRPPRAAPAVRDDLPYIALPHLAPHSLTEPAREQRLDTAISRARSLLCYHAELAPGSRASGRDRRDAVLGVENSESATIGGRLG
jgi:hypothetical protein